MILDKALAKPAAILRAQSAQDLIRFRFHLIQEHRLQALNRLEPFRERLERRQVFGVADCPGEREEQRILAFMNSTGWDKPSRSLWRIAA